MDKKLILIAEDEAAYGKILNDMLGKEGYDVIVTVDGDELLQIARTKKSALVILDLIMPLKNGFQVIAEMKRDEQLKKIPIIALSNLGQEEDILRAKGLGADDYIVKSDEIFYTVIDRIKKQIN